MGEELQVALNQEGTPTPTPTGDTGIDSKPKYVPFTKKDIEKATFLAWLLLTDKERIERGLPRTQALLAEKLDVKPETLSYWKKLPDFQAEFDREIRARVKYDLGVRIPDVNRALLKLATGKDTRAMEMVYKLLGVMPKEGATVEVNQNQVISFEQIVKESTESWEEPEWAKGRVIDVPVEGKELAVKGKEDETTVRTDVG